MGYGSAAEEERMLSYASPKETMPSTAVAHTQSLPTTMGSTTPPAPPPTASPEQSTSPIMAAVAEYRVVEYTRQAWTECRPWSEFYSTRAISVPPFAALSDRVASNLHVYRANYQVVAGFWLALTMVLSPLAFVGALVFLLLLEKWTAKRARNNNDTLHYKDKGTALFAVGLIIYVTRIGELLVGSFLFSAVSIAGHASLHEPDHIETEIATV